MTSAIEKPSHVFDRDREWTALADFTADARPEATLGLVSGRRRQGKTYLLRSLAAAADGSTSRHLAEAGSVPALAAVLQPQREPGAQLDGGCGFGAKRGRHVAAGEHRVTPVVERDQLGQQLGAQAASVTGDRIDLQPHATAHVPFPPGTGSTAAASSALHHPRACRSVSPRKTCSALATMSAVPSGCRHAPRPVTCPSQRRTRARSQVPPAASRSSCPAMASSPKTQGPHWPADERAR